MEKISNLLNRILVASGWSQDQLADRIGVSFPTLNSWVNGKSEPRAGAVQKIELVAAEILGTDSVDMERLKNIKHAAEQCKYSVKKLLNNRESLEKIGVSFTYHSNGTEGSTMTENDVEAVILENKILKNRTSREQREAVNHQTALYFLLDELNNSGADFRFTPELIQATHLRLMNGIISDAGYWRNHGVRISGSNTPLANFIKIPELVQNWCNLANSETMDKIALMAETHARFEQIHPFSDGNGRTGRLLMFVLALKLGLVPPILPKDRRMAYYKYLELAQTRELYDLLELYLAECVIATSDELNKNF